MSTFGAKTEAEQKELVTQIAECLKKHELGSVPVSIYREAVSRLSGGAVEARSLLKVAKDLPAAQSEKAKQVKEEVNEITKGLEGVTIELNAALGAGDKYVTITDVTTIEDPAATVNIEHTAGDVLLIDFWATWCPPCQAPMAHNQKMLEEHGDKWGDKVKIIGLSIDKDAEVVRKHVESKGWQKPIHYHRGASKYGETYKVNGVPHVMLVDTNGKIVFKGHPAGRTDLADDLTKLLAGEVLTGEGCAPAEAKEGEAEPEGQLAEGFVACNDADLAAIRKEMDTFKDTKAAELQALAKEDAEGLMRDFCVVVLEASFAPSTMTWSRKYENYRVFVGAEDKIKKCGEHAKTVLKEADWTFAIQEQLIPR